MDRRESFLSNFKEDLARQLDQDASSRSSASKALGTQGQDCPLKGRDRNPLGHLRMDQGLQ